MSVEAVTTPSSILVTGANAGIGFSVCRQVAEKKETKRVILACRNQAKAEQAKADLEEATGKTIFEILIIDLKDFKSVVNAANELKHEIDCLILNAGGPGGNDFVQHTDDGVASIMALNVTGSVLFTNELIKNEKLVKGATVMYASSEAARGVDSFGFPAPAIESGSVDEFKSVLDGSKFVQLGDVTYETTYSFAKCVGSLWIASMARQNTDYRWVSVSPGMTTGTNILNDLGGIKKFMFICMAPLLGWFAVSHGVDVGALRYLDTVYDTKTYENGMFYASADASKLTGAIGPQFDFFTDLAKEEYQDNANTAIQTFLPTISN
jgi:NAD(P)-dependent dehydrogenase (short-subunit alcohol dehydrogenase family)